MWLSPLTKVIRQRQLKRLKSPVSTARQVIGLTWVMDSPLVAHCDYVETYTFGDGKDIAGEKTMKGLLSTVELLQQTEGYAHYDDFQDGVSKINRIVWRACEQVAERAQAFAQKYKDDKVIYTFCNRVWRNPIKKACYAPCGRAGSRRRRLGLGTQRRGD